MSVMCGLAEQGTSGRSVPERAICAGEERGATCGCVRRCRDARCVFLRWLVQDSGIRGAASTTASSTGLTATSSSPSTTSAPKPATISDAIARFQRARHPRPQRRELYRGPAIVTIYSGVRINTLRSRTGMTVPRIPTLMAHTASRRSQARPISRRGKTYIQSVTKGVAGLCEYDSAHGLMLLRISCTLTPDQEKQYESAIDS